LQLPIRLACRCYQSFYALGRVQFIWFAFVLLIRAIRRSTALLPYCSTGEEAFRYGESMREAPPGENFAKLCDARIMLTSGMDPAAVLYALKT
jgi:hypothetical protein